MKKSAKGFTLVEVVIALVIFSVLVSTAGVILLTGQNIFSKSVSETSAKQIGDEFCELLNARLSYATNISFSDSEEEFSGGRAGYNETISLKKADSSDSQVMISHGSGTYNEVINQGRFIIELKTDGFLDADGALKKDQTVDSLNVTVSVKGSDMSVLYERSFSIELLNYTDDTSKAVFKADTKDNKSENLYINYSYIE